MLGFVAWAPSGVFSLATKHSTGWRPVPRLKQDIVEKRSNSAGLDDPTYEFDVDQLGSSRTVTKRPDTVPAIPGI